MGLETGDFIEDLVDTNPTGNDPKSQGDDHLRLIKKCIQGSFPGGDGAWNFPTQDPVFRDPTFRDIDCQSIDVATVIQTTPSACVAAARCDGATGAFLGAEFGFQGTSFTRISAGVYEFALSETNITVNDICAAVDVFYATAYGVYTLGTAAVLPGPGAFRIQTAFLSSNGQQNTADPVSFGIAVFNPARNIP